MNVLPKWINKAIPVVYQADIYKGEDMVNIVLTMFFVACEIVTISIALWLVKDEL